jgi:hypothetical protein
MPVLCCRRPVTDSQILIPQNLARKEQDKRQYTKYEDKNKG